MNDWTVMDRRVTGSLVAVSGLAVLSWLGYAAVAYRRYGHAGGARQNASLNRCLPAPEIAERHEIRVGAPRT